MPSSDQFSPATPSTPAFEAEEPPLGECSGGALAGLSGPLSGWIGLAGVVALSSHFVFSTHNARSNATYHMSKSIVAADLLYLLIGFHRQVFVLGRTLVQPEI